MLKSSPAVVSSVSNPPTKKTRWWFQRFFSHLGKIPILDSCFSDGLKPPTRKVPQVDLSCNEYSSRSRMYTLPKANREFRNKP